MKRKIWLTIGIVFGVMTLGMGWLAVSSIAMFDVEKITGYSQNTILYDANGDEVTNLSGAENRTGARLSEIPNDVQLAFIAAEDVRFYEHFGVDPWRIGGAIVQDVRSLSFEQGASTITQQLVKLTHLTSDKTILRKLREAFIAIALERKMTKAEILEAYLNTIYFGNGAYGIQSAAETYFSKSVSKLTIDEGALLAAIIKSPSNYAPDTNSENATRRRNLILNTMAESGFITEDEAKEFAAKPIDLAMKSQSAFSYGYYVDAVLDEAAQALSIGVDELLAGGYRIYTALKPTMQASAEALFKNAKNFPASATDGTLAQAALVALDPASGEIMALLGGRKYEIRRGLNRATQIKRQPGSALKPICVYAAAIDKFKYLPSDIIDDAQREFAGGYAPRNIGDVYHGKVTLREALARSMNVASVDLLARTDISVARGYIERAGITLDAADSNYALALGSLTYGVSPAELAAAYAPLTNGGTSVKAHTIREIKDSSGATIYRAEHERQRVLSAQSAYMVTDMLRSAADWGSARKLSDLSFDAAGKTGTVAMQGGGNRDAWMAAYTPTVSVCVWMGFDQPDATHKLSDSSGGSAEPAKLVTAFLKANSKYAAKAFSRPAGIAEVLIDMKALKTLYKPMLISDLTPKSQTTREVFLTGQAPTEVSNIWKAPDAPIGFSVSEADGIPKITLTARNDFALYLIHRIIGSDDKIVAQLSGLVGETLTFSDMQADTGSAPSYYAVPVNKELYEDGKTLAGEASAIIRFKPRRELLDFWGGAEMEAEPTDLPTSA